MHFLLSCSFHSSSWFSFLWYYSTSRVTESTALRGNSEGFWTSHMHWGSQIGYFIMFSMIKCSSMAFPWEQGTMTHTNPLGFILSAFSQRQCCATTQVSTSSPGCWEKLSQADRLLFLGDWRLDSISQLEVSCTDKKEVSDWYPKYDQKNPTKNPQTTNKNNKPNQPSKQNKNKTNKHMKNISVFLSTCSFNWSSSEKSTSCMFSTSPVLTSRTPNFVCKCETTSHAQI